VKTVKEVSMIQKNSAMINPVSHEGGRRKLLFLFAYLFIGCGLTLSPLQAAEKGPPVPFTADFIATEDGETVSGGKYFAAPEGIRMEGVTGGEPYVMIINFPKRATYHLMAKERMYIEMSIDPEETTATTDDLFSGMSFGEACPDMGGKGTRLGRETLHGRKVEKWRCQNLDGDEVTVWHDTKLKMAIRAEDPDGIFEMSNIKEGPLSPQLFQPPADYTKFEMPLPIPSGRPSSAPKNPQGGAEDQKATEGMGEEILKGIRGLTGR
jgi:hypothetical protein